MLEIESLFFKTVGMHQRSFFFRVAVFLISSILLVTTLPLGGWLLLHFETIQGFLLALLGIIGPLWGYWLLFGQNLPNYKPIKRVGRSFIGVIVLVLLVLAPSGRSGTDSPIQHIYVKNSRFVRLSPFNIIPEIEQMNVGANLLGPLDPLMGNAKANRLANLTLEIYRELEKDPDFKSAGSVMGLPMRQPFGIPFDNGHSYLYIPDNRSEKEPLPVLVFLHGFGGPFKAYQWIWRDFAEENQVAVLSPSYGIGIWTAEASSEIVIRALEEANEQSPVPLDLNSVWIAGLSNGGYGTIYTAVAEPDQFEGLILISPGMPTDLMNGANASFNKEWHNRPVLLIHGEQDVRMPMGYLNQHIGFMEHGGIRLETILYPEEDHFLFFAQRDQLMQQIGEWIQSIEDES